MANIDSNLVKKNRRERGTHGGREQTITGIFNLADGASLAVADILRVAKLGENVRPIRAVLQVVPVSGTPVVTNGSVSLGWSPDGTATYKRATGEEFTPVTENATGYAASTALPAAGSKTVIDLKSPAGANIAPTYFIAKPSGAGALSVADGAAELHIAITFLAEQVGDGFVYDEFVNQKVKNA